MRFVALLALVALIPIVGAGGYMLGQKLAAKPPAPPKQAVDTTGLVRYTLMDSEGDSGVIRIVCKAWSNDADFDPYATVTKDAIGFRFVSDCVTKASRKGQGPHPPGVPAMP